MSAKRQYTQARKQKRTSPGARIASPLVEWLNRAMAEAKDNNEQARQSLERVWSFLVNINKYYQQRSALNREFRTKTVTRKMVLRAADSDFDLQNKLTRTLAAYSFSPILDYDAPRFRSCFDAGSNADSFACYGIDLIYPHGFREADAVLIGFQLAQQNHVSNIRVCARRKCRRFFYSSRRKKRFCTDACRSGVWNTTERAKEGRRRRARKLREKEKKYRENLARRKSQGRRKTESRTHK